MSRVGHTEGAGRRALTSTAPLARAAPPITRTGSEAAGWHLRQKTVARPPTVIDSSGLPQRGQGRPASP